MVGSGFALPIRRAGQTLDWVRMQNSNRIRLTARRGVLAISGANVMAVLDIWLRPESWTDAGRMTFEAWFVFVIVNGLFVVSLLFSWHGKSWAKWIVLAWCAVGWVAKGGSILFIHGTNVSGYWIMLIVIALEMWGCYLLLSKEAAQWFKKQRLA